MKARKSKGQKALEQVAVQNGVSVDEVCAEIQQAIEIGMSNPNPEIKLKWQQLCKNGVPPTPEELIMRLGKLLKY